MILRIRPIGWPPYYVIALKKKHEKHCVKDGLTGTLFLMVVKNANIYRAS